MRIHLFQHVAFEGPGCIGNWCRTHSHPVSATRFFEESAQIPAMEAIDALVIMGGPMGVYDDAVYPWLREEKRAIEQAMAAGKRIIGICLGAQLIAQVLGAPVRRGTHKEIGWFPISRTEEAKTIPLARYLPRTLTVLHWHGDSFDIPAGMTRIAQSEACPNQGFTDGEKIVALQFHMEITQSGIQELITHCGEELTDGPFIQDGPSIIRKSMYCSYLNRTMEELCDHFL